MQLSSNPIYEIGDRVVAITPHDEDRKGLHATVLDVSPIPGLRFDDGRYGAERQQDLVLEEIYNSPLEKALR